MNGPLRLAHQARGSIEVELLRHARTEHPTADDLARLAGALGLGTTAATCATTAVAESYTLEAAAGGSGLITSSGTSTLMNASVGSIQARVTSAIRAEGGVATAGKSVSGAASAVGGAAVASTKPAIGLLSGAAVRWWLFGGVCVAIGAGAMIGHRALRRNDAASFMAAKTTVRQKSGEAVSVGGASTSAAGDSAGSVAPRSDARIETRTNGADGLVSLTPEIELLDRARSLTDAGRPGEALEQLNAYDARFPVGTLAPEARLIRVRALIRSGQRAQAVEQGEEFLSTAPASPYARKIRELLTSEGQGRSKRGK